MADLTRENGRLNDRIVDLVGLNEESQKRMTPFEETMSGLRREMGELTARTNENKDAPPWISLLRKGIEEDKAVTETAPSTIPAAPAGDGTNAGGPRHTPAPSAYGGAPIGGRDRSRGRDAESTASGSGGLFGADVRQRKEQCDLCGDYTDERNMHPCPRCRSRMCLM